jgi:hypothetical protein
MWIYGAYVAPILRHNYQRDSAHMPCGFNDRETLEARCKMPAQKRTCFVALRTFN